MFSGIPRSLLAHATWMGLLVGAAYSLSPLAIYFTVAAVVVVWWAGRGLPPTERRWVLALIVAAIAVRLLMVAGLFLATNHDHQQFSSFPFERDGLYFVQRSLWIRNIWLGTPVDSHVYGSAIGGEYGWTSYLHLLAYVHYLIGPSPYGVRLINIWLFVAGAIVLHRLVRSSFGPIAAYAGLSAVLLLPSLVAWSVSTLKESLQFALAVVTIASATFVFRGPTWGRRALALICCTFALMALGTVRTGALFIAAAGLGAGIALTVVRRRPVSALATLVVITAIGVALVKPDRVPAIITERVAEAANVHLGNVRTEGHAYKLLDRRFYYGERLAPMGGNEAARFVMRAIAAFIALPLPWDITSRAELAYLAEQIVWWVLLAFAILGVAAGRRRDDLLTFILAAYSVVGSVVIALNSGNVGSMIRHRDTVLPFIVWLSALGAMEVIHRIAHSSVLAARRDLSEAPGVACP